MRRVHGHNGKGGTHRSLTYNSWRGMIGRCRHPSHPANAKYRDLGICDRWQEGEDGKSGFECFLEDMGERPSRRHTLDREKGHLGYSKDNCRWATLERQARNRCVTKMVEYKGERMALADAYEQSGTRLKYRTILYYLWKGLSFEAALLKQDTRNARKRKSKCRKKTKSKST